eukprot:5769812-Alexandrium_andersonii.AAC.1
MHTGCSKRPATIWHVCHRKRWLSLHKRSGARGLLCPASAAAAAGSPSSRAASNNRSSAPSSS